jgi:hypothetical protein
MPVQARRGRSPWKPKKNFGCSLGAYHRCTMATGKYLSKQKAAVYLDVCEKTIDR